MDFWNLTEMLNKISTQTQNGQANFNNNLGLNNPDTWEAVLSSHIDSQRFCLGLYPGQAFPYNPVGSGVPVTDQGPINVVRQNGVPESAYKTYSESQTIKKNDKLSIVAWMAGEAKASGLPPELPIMCIIQETGIRNLDGGDPNPTDIYLDGLPNDGKGPSRGFFQNLCRPFTRIGKNGKRHKHDANCTISQGLDPAFELNFFIQEAIKIKSRYISSGSTSYGHWIQAVQRSFDSTGQTYQRHLSEAQDLIRQSQSK